MRFANKTSIILNLVILLLIVSIIVLWANLFLLQSGLMRTEVGIKSYGIIGGPFVPYLVMQVSPPGYPPVGGTWNINVFAAKNWGSWGPILEPAPNVNVTVTLLSWGKERVVRLTTNEKGEAEFDYQPEYTDIAFQAQGLNIVDSDAFVLTSRFVQTQDIENPLYFGAIAIVAEIATIFIDIRRTGNQISKLRTKIESSVIAIDLFLLIFATLVSIYSKLFLGTIWGYPEDILSGLITVTLLKYVFYTGILMFIGIIVYKILVSKSQDSKTRKTAL